MTAEREPLAIGIASIEAGARAIVDVPVSVLSNHTPMASTVQVVHGRKPRPRVLPRRGRPRR